MLIHVRRRAAVITALVVLGASCGGGSDDPAPGSALPTVLEVTPTATPVDPAPPTPTPTAAPTETPTPAPESTVDEQAALEAAVLEAHAGYLEAYFESGRLADPDYPPLLEHTTGASLQAAQASRTRYREQGVTVVGSYESRPRFVEQRSDGSVLVEDCFLDAAPAIDSSGRVVAEVDEFRIYLQTVLVYLDNRWKVSETLTAREPCDF
jgi:hypothetical protein